MTFFVLAALSLQAFSLSKEKGQRRVVRLTRRLCGALIWLLNLRCEIDGLEALETNDKPLLILSNHMSYVDVIVLNALLPSVFVTSREIEETAVLGWITKAAGCAFVERRNIWQVQEDIVRLAALLSRGFNVTLFPEGSTSSGEEILEFKRTLLEAALRSRCRVIPVCLRYERVDGRPYGLTNKDSVAWYGKMTFFPHLWRLMLLRSIDVRVSVLGEVAFRGHKSRKRLAHEASVRIAERFHGEASPPRAH